MSFAPQGSEAWFLERCGHATASCFSDALAKPKDKGNAEALTRKAYRMRLVAERLTGKPAPSFSNKHTDRGTEQEPDARLAYELRVGNIVEQVGFIRHPLIEWCGASCDGLVDDDGTAEIKSVLPHIQIATITASGFPSEHKAQVQGGLWITNRKWCDFISYSPDLPGKLSLYVFRVERDDEYIDTVLEPGIVKFLEDVDASVSALMKLAA